MGRISIPTQYYFLYTILMYFLSHNPFGFLDFYINFFLSFHTPHVNNFIHIFERFRLWPIFAETCIDKKSPLVKKAVQNLMHNLICWPSPALPHLPDPNDADSMPLYNDENTITNITQRLLFFESICQQHGPFETYSNTYTRSFFIVPCVTQILVPQFLYNNTSSR